jgi:hypothetical protein
MYKIKWFHFIWTIFLIPIFTGSIWHFGFHSVVIGMIVFRLMLILGYLNPSEFRK